MYVVATAGHVDHGKSTLVRALTGMEPDRWAEERRRGMTIDLGYAWTSLPSGAELAFVDVPGHQRFIGNMLAGLGPAPAVLFVVAADEGWARQSQEHLAAVDALQLRHGLLAVTRSDLADPSAALADSRARIARSSLGDVPAVVVSGATGQGVAELRAALGELVTRLPAPGRTDRVRLWIDRSFSVRGSGTVVTGTLGAGRVAVGDEFELHGRRVSVRGVQSLGHAHERVDAVARVALNLRGIAKEDVRRGDVLLTSGAWLQTGTVDVRIAGADVRELPAELVLHVGTAAVPVRVRPLGSADAARLTLDIQLPLQIGDRAILRDPGRQSVAAGVLVLDPDPPALIRRGAAAARAGALADVTVPADLAAEVARRRVVSRIRLRAIGVDGPVPAGVHAVGEWLVADELWRYWIARLYTEMDGWATAHPLEPGMPLEALRRALDVPDRAVLAALLKRPDVRVEDGRALHGAPRADLGAAESSVAVLEKRLAAEPFAAPERHELAALRLGRRELAAAERAGRLLRISEDIVLLPDAPARAVAALRAVPQPFTLSEARQALGTTRRVAVPLMEYLDEHALTERGADQRRRVLPR